MITVFSQDNCVPCKKVKTWLDNKGVEYTERNIQHDPTAFEELVSMNYNSTPVIVAGSDSWAGIDLAKMKALVA